MGAAMLRARVAWSMSVSWMIEWKFSSDTALEDDVLMTSSDKRISVRKDVGSGRGRQLPARHS